MKHRWFAPLLLSVLIAGCSDGPTEPTSLHDARYCELIALFPDGALLAGDVYSTLGYNKCPQAAWDALDLAAINTELGSQMVLANGPRFMLMDEIVVRNPGEPMVRTFGQLDMALVAVVTIDPADGTDPYIVRTVARDTEFIFYAGQTVYDLIDPNGDSYRMQSYAHIVDDTLSVDALAGLGGRLVPPVGWSFVVSQLEQPSSVVAVGATANVILDELQNAYQRIE